jgi:exodeoxyribonuclease VII small subunit
MTPKPALTKLSFEEAAQELEIIVNRLESGEEDLEASIELYTRGAALKEHCEKKLHEARLKVEKITQKSE